VAVSGNDTEVFEQPATTPADIHVRSLELDTGPGVAREARLFVDDALTAWHMGSQRDDALLIVSELATNAYRYDGPHMIVDLRRDHESLFIGVEDGSTSSPPNAPIDPDNGSESGRGLAIVAAVAQSWGIATTLAGKQVWARLDIIDRRSSA